MNEQTLLLLVIIGGAAGLSIVGIAFWMMRQEGSAHTNPASGTETPTQTTDVSPGTEAAPGIEAVSTEPTGPTPPASVPEAIAAAPASPTLSSPTFEIEPVPTASPVSPPAPPEPASAPAPTWPSSLATTETPSPPPATPIEQEVLRLWRSPAGRLIVEVSGKRYRARDEISDYATAQKIISAAKDLNQFLNMASSAPARKPEPERPVVKVSLEEVAAQPVKLPTMDILKQMRYLREQSKKPELQIKSIMDEINDILQKKIAGTPLAERGLKVADGLHGGIFSLDGRDYESLDELHDPEAMEAVRAAVQEWDNK